MRPRVWWINATLIACLLGLAVAVCGAWNDPAYCSEAEGPGQDREELEWDLTEAPTPKYPQDNIYIDDKGVGWRWEEDKDGNVVSGERPPERDPMGGCKPADPPNKAVGTNDPDFLGGALNKDQQARWDRYIRALETNLPPIDGDVIVRFDFLDTELAYTIHDGTNFIIVIDYRLCFYAKRDTLIHEWAHALDWWTAGNDDDHGPAWALQYGRCYEAVMKVRYRE